MDRQAQMLDFHRRHPRSSELVFGGADAGDGRSSYEHLADRLVPGVHDTVLDLACGDGILLELLRARHGAAWTLAGVDVSPEQVRHARERLGSAPAALAEAEARALPLRTASFDAVISHMALMLMTGLDGVAREIARVLREGGLLAAITGARGKPEETPRRIFARLAELRDDEGSPAAPADGDRIRTPEGVREIFTEPSWRDVTVTPLSLRVSVPARDVFPWLETAYYPIDALAEVAKSALRTWIGENVESLAPGGRMPWTFYVHLITARRGAGG